VRVLPGTGSRPRSGGVRDLVVLPGGVGCGPVGSWARGLQPARLRGVVGGRRAPCTPASGPVRQARCPNPVAGRGRRGDARRAARRDLRDRAGRGPRRVAQHGPRLRRREPAHRHVDRHDREGPALERHPDGHRDRHGISLEHRVRRPEGRLRLVPDQPRQREGGLLPLRRPRPVCRHRRPQGRPGPGPDSDPQADGDPGPDAHVDCPPRRRRPRRPRRPTRSPGS
jgi:hypothetical protein